MWPFLYAIDSKEQKKEKKEPSNLNFIILAVENYNDYSTKAIDA